MGQSAPLDSKKIAKNWEKEGKNQGKEKIGKKRKNQEEKVKNRESSFCPS